MLGTYSQTDKQVPNYMIYFMERMIMEQNIFVICDCFDIHKNQIDDFVRMIQYVHNIMQGIDRQVHAIIGSKAYDSCKERLDIICDEIFLLDTGELSNYSVYEYCEHVYKVIEEKNIQYIFVPSSIAGRVICAWIAGKMHMGAIADVINMELQNGMMYYMRATTYNNLMSSIICRSKTQIASLRGQVDTVDSLDHRKAKLYQIPMVTIKYKCNYKRDNIDTAELDFHHVTIGIGRGISQEERNLIIQFAKLYNIPIVGTRPLVEDGIIQFSQQVGQSGRTIACKLYIAVGISGAVQHLVGILNCKKIIAINPNEDAPIHERADISIKLKAADVFKALLG